MFKGILPAHRGKCKRVLLILVTDSHRDVSKQTSHCFLNSIKNLVDKDIKEILHREKMVL